MDNIYLCGFMGCGKTTIGKRLAQLLGRRFLDLDAFIEKKTKRKIHEIFAESGEDQFRQLEHEFLSEVSKMKHAVVSVGGGTFSYEENIILAKQSGKIIYLYLPFETCYKRIRGDRHRPLVAKNTKPQLLELYNKRHTIYKIVSTYQLDAIHSPERCARSLAKLEK